MRPCTVSRPTRALTPAERAHRRRRVQSPPQLPEAITHHPLHSREEASQPGVAYGRYLNLEPSAEYASASSAIEDDTSYAWTSPLTRLPPGAPLAEMLEAEQLLMDFVIWLATCRPSGRPVSARSIAKYVSEIRVWHLRTQRTHLCGSLDYGQLCDLIRGVSRQVELWSSWP